MHQFHYLFAASLVLLSTAAPAEEKLIRRCFRPSAQLCGGCDGCNENGLTW
jgi:hypothetical protein